MPQSFFNHRLMRYALLKKPPQYFTSHLELVWWMKARLHQNPTQIK